MSVLTGSRNLIPEASSLYPSVTWTSDESPCFWSSGVTPWRLPGCHSLLSILSETVPRVELSLLCYFRYRQSPWSSPHYAGTKEIKMSRALCHFHTFIQHTERSLLSMCYTGPTMVPGSLHGNPSPIHAPHCSMGNVVKLFPMSCCFFKLHQEWGTACPCLSQNHQNI